MQIINKQPDPPAMQPSDSMFPFSSRIKLFRNMDKVPLENLDNLRHAMADLHTQGKLTASDQVFLIALTRKIQQRIQDHKDHQEELKENI